jgi:endonuclease III
MVRGPNEADLGLWRDRVDTAKLLIPVDVHIHKLARNLGLTARNTANWQTADEITAALRTFDARDPVRFDFALCHMGMVQRCPSKRDPVRCDGCGVRPVCRHWSKSSVVSRQSSAQDQSRDDRRLAPVHQRSRSKP